MRRKRERKIKTHKKRGSRKRGKDLGAVRERKRNTGGGYEK